MLKLRKFYFYPIKVNIDNHRRPQNSFHGGGTQLINVSINNLLYKILNVKLVFHYTYIYLSLTGLLKSP